MLEINCQPYYTRVRDFAEKKGLLAAFEEQIEWLRKYGDPEQKGLWKIVMTIDFAPASFALVWFMKMADGSYEFFANGALIYHGDQSGWREDSAYVDPLSVAISKPPPDRPWLVHT
jgi:hypothetical protein